MAKPDPDITAELQRMRCAEENADIEAFLKAYPRATGETLELVRFQERPDAVCMRPDGTFIGVEHTRVRRSPEAAF